MESDSSTTGRKLVVLGIPWEIDTAGLKQYMSKFGPMDDVVVMKERGTGRSRGFGYVTFTSLENAEKVASMEHELLGRKLEIKLAIPKEEMKPVVKRGTTRIFVARIPPTITEEQFRKYFEQFGDLTDCYMPKDPMYRNHRGIGFITFESTESVEKIMSSTHELDGSTLAIDRANPKDEGGPRFRNSSFSTYPPLDFPRARGRALDMPRSRYSTYNAFDRMPSSMASHSRHYRSISPPPSPPFRYSRGYDLGLEDMGGMSRVNLCKVFVGKLPQEASVDDLRNHFSHFGAIEDIYIPKDPKKDGHRGFGFVTFMEEEVAKFVSRRPHHEICGKQVVVDQATPADGPPGAFTLPRSLSSLSGSSFRDHSLNPYYYLGGSSQMPLSDYGIGGSEYGSSSEYVARRSHSSRSELRYRPY